jgi:hypothetical protein
VQLPQVLSQMNLEIISAFAGSSCAKLVRAAELVAARQLGVGAEFIAPRFTSL